jgi:hypothetical protein
MEVGMNRQGKACGNPGLILAVLLACAGQAMPALAQTVGMVADRITPSVTVFDADTNIVLGTVPIPTIRPFDVGDCTVTADQTRGFVTDYNWQIWVIDLTTSPPSLARGPNPIPISNIGEDTAISPDQKFLGVCGPGGSGPISVIDIATQTEISTFALGTDCNSVDICSDGSVLVTSFITGNVRRLTLSGTGTLTDTGEVLFSGGAGTISSPNNVFCAPDGMSGIVIRRDPQEIRSFTIPGLTPVNTRALTGTGFSGISGEIHPAGDRAFARSNGGFVDAFSYNSITGVLGAAPLFSIPIAGAPTYYGMDQMVLHPNGTKLYVSQPNALEVYNASTGALLTSITASGIVEPTGVCLAHEFQPSDTIPPEIMVSATPETLWPPNGKLVPVTIGATITDAGSGVDQSTVTCEVADEYDGVQSCGEVTVGLEGSYTFTIALEAARRGNDADGRHYTITISAQDNAGNEGIETTSVLVPHDQGH